MQYKLESDGSFIIDNYQQTKAFSNFFPGVAGLYGIPMWAFYVNRGQAISSFGIESKDKAILEFQPANKAYRLTSLQGFRTFLKVSDGKSQKFAEPFAHPHISGHKVHQRMRISSHDLTIEEINITLGLKVSVNYFTVPQEPYAGLVRRVKIENISKKGLTIECIDGLPLINPYGLKDWLAKNMTRTIEAWMGVHNIDKGAPFYQLTVEVADTPQVTHIKEGNFYFAFDEKSHKLLKPIADPACVFGYSTDFLVPENFYADRNFTVPARQNTVSRTPSALAHGKWTLRPGQAAAFCALTGFVHDLPELNSVVKRALKPGFISTKVDENRAIVDDIKGYCLTRSSLPAFDQYCGQTFLDNVLRGGLPISVQTAQGPVAFNVYSRKHGDPERDYNFFTLTPTYFSQGNGNYRDVNQNRRNDVWFNQDVGDNAVVNFMNLLQADGYNPLIIKGMPLKLDRNPAKAKAELAKLLGSGQKQEHAEFGEGYWSDHWTYNLDLIESYLRLYPEHLRTLLLEKKVFHFHFNDAYVLPRHKRYILTDRGVRQYHSVAEGDKDVKAKEKGFRLRVKGGQGDVYHTTLLVKLLCVLANKVASLDPSGIGVEMEANKPNWYDALNGLPGLLGSSINETFEIKRWALFAIEALNQLRINDSSSVEIFAELADFMQGLTNVLGNEHDPLKYWHKANDLKEHYRQTIRLGIDGKQHPISVAELKKFLEGAIACVDRGIAAARNSQGLFASYYYHEVTQHEVLDKNHPGGVHIKPLAFKRHDLPYFLEGFVHALRVEEKADVGELYQAVRKSPLYDRELGMYKVNAELSKESEEIGRTRIFPRGWLENESIWLHMEYKYLLELLRRGFFTEFFNDARRCCVPFMDPARYGRSILENSSFIVSSAHQDDSLHGQGFVARLSGSTAEFVHMWLLMSAGLKPFEVDTNGQLILAFKPVLPGWLFAQDHTYAFKFLNSALVVYHNPKGKDTFGAGAVKPVKMTLKYAGRTAPVGIVGGRLMGKQAEDVRSKKVERIDIVLG